LLNRQDREDLGINKLDPKVRDYIAALETECERLQHRSHVHRIQLRACSAKLETVNLRNELARLAGQAAAQDTVSQVRRKKLQRAV
jgi:hypothetical protein